MDAITKAARSAGRHRGQALLEVMLRQTCPKVQSVARLVADMLPDHELHSYRKSDKGHFIHDLYRVNGGTRTYVLTRASGSEVVEYVAGRVTSPDASPVQAPEPDWEAVRRSLENDIVDLIAQVEKKHGCHVIVKTEEHALRVHILKEVA